jgi:hypothetical protein
MSACTLAERAPKWLCSDCGAPKPGVEQVDVTIQEPSPGRATLTFVSGTGVPLIRRSHLLRLGDENIAKYLHIGEVKNEKGKVLADWVTCRAKHKVIVRGDSRAGHRLCQTCGRDIYFAMGKPYLYPSPPSGVEVLQGRLSLIVSSALRAQLALEDWKVVSIEPLPVLSSPRDSLPAFHNPAA